MKLGTRQLTVTAGERVLIRDLDLVLEAGQRWAILGPNGSGKTTLLHTLAGLRPPLSGHMELDGRPLETLERREIARRLGLMPQDTPDPFPATVLETALIGRHPERRRLAFATLLVQDPPLLLLDEPTNHLDFPHQHAVLRQVSQLTRQGRCAAMSLHDVNLASRYCSHALFLHGDGRSEQGTIGEMLTSAKLERLYGMPFRHMVFEDATMC